MKGKYFCRCDWTGSIRLIRLAKSSEARTRKLARLSSLRLLGRVKCLAGTINRDGADFIHCGRIGLTQVARGSDCSFAIGAVDDVESQELFLALGERTIGHHAVTWTAQHAGSLRRAKPRRRPEATLAREAVVHLVQLEHQRRIRLRRPGGDFLFDVIGQDGIPHGFLSFVLELADTYPQGRFGGGYSDIVCTDVPRSSTV